MMKTKQDNNVTNRIDAVYAQNETQLLYLIILGAVCDENETGQRRDQSIGLVHVETEAELLGVIRLTTICDENQIGELCD